MEHDTTLDRAHALIQSGDTAEARDLLLAVVERDPANIAAWEALVRITPEPAQALHYLEELLARDPENEWAAARRDQLLGRTTAMQVATTPNGGRQRRRDTPSVERRSRMAAWWSQVRADWRLFRQNRLALLGLVLIGLFGVMALSHPILMETVWVRGIYHPEVGYDLNYAPWPAPPVFPEHILGLDGQGRDILSQLLASTQPSIVVAFTAALTTDVVSTVFASLGAYFRGPLDAVLSNISDALLLIPVPILMIIIGSRFYSEIGSLEFGLLYGILAGASSAAIVMRSHALKLMNWPFMEAAELTGAGPGYIISRHLVPHMLPLVAVHMMLTVTGAVVAEGFIAFLGLATEARLNWGTMVYNAISFLQIKPDLPWAQILAPSLSLSLFAAAFYFVARGLQDVADPRIKGER
ncbi:MAG: ABC transporter permease subunit [Anaerolineae bacterium]